jgi:hypothetical protein
MVFTPLTPLKQLASVDILFYKYCFLLKDCYRPISLNSALSLTSLAIALLIVYIIETL